MSSSLFFLSLDNWMSPVILLTSMIDRSARLVSELYNLLYYFTFIPVLFGHKGNLHLE